MNIGFVGLGKLGLPCALAIDSVKKHKVRGFDIDKNVQKYLKEKTIPFLPYTAHHEEHYRSALTMFKDKPIVGHGSGLFRFLCTEDKYYFNSLSCSTHPQYVP